MQCIFRTRCVTRECISKPASAVVRKHQSRFRCGVAENMNNQKCLEIPMNFGDCYTGEGVYGHNPHVRPSLNEMTTFSYDGYDSFTNQTILLNEASTHSYELQSSEGVDNYNYCAYKTAFKARYHPYLNSAPVPPASAHHLSPPSSGINVTSSADYASIPTMHTSVQDVAYCSQAYDRPSSSNNNFNCPVNSQVYVALKFVDLYREGSRRNMN